MRNKLSVDRILRGLGLRQGWAPPKTIKQMAHDRGRSAASYDVIITPNEICYAHGTGVLLARLFGEQSNITSIRSRSNYFGRNDIATSADLILPYGIQRTEDIHRFIESAIEGVKIDRILCIPFYPTDLEMALEAVNLSGAKLGVWFMDDNCLETGQLSKNRVQRVINKADLCVAISAELKNNYQNVFGKKFYYIPPLVADKYLQKATSAPVIDRSIAMIGNVWSPNILRCLCDLFVGHCTRLRWLAPQENLWSGRISKRELARHGIDQESGGDHNHVQSVIRGSSCIVIPSDPGGLGDSERAIGRFSLPSRISFIFAASGTPIIVLGHADTAAARFVVEHGLGRVCPYDADALAECVGEVNEIAEQRRIREAAFALAPQFKISDTAHTLLGAIAGRNELHNWSGLE